MPKLFSEPRIIHIRFSAVVTFLYLKARCFGLKKVGNGLIIWSPSRHGVLELKSMALRI